MSPFNDSRVSVIESKLETHERYFTKIEESIEKLSEVSLGIKEMLIKHDAKLEERAQEESTIYSKIEELKESGHEEHQDLARRIESVEKKVEELTKWRYLVAGGLVIVGLFIGQVMPNSPSAPLPLLQELVK